MKELAAGFGIHRTTVSSHLTEHDVSGRVVAELDGLRRVLRRARRLAG
jgi:hypothetical protein